MTKYEKYILIFLVLIALIGMGFLFYQKATNRSPLEIFNMNEPGIKSQTGQLSIVNINTAREDELAALKGIGPKLAARIIEYRKANGYFSIKEDLKKVKGIGQHKFEEIKEFIKTE
ncbi:MAG: hypothetical protein COS99_03265 [Candidatus Omnitrophica bacterium CG07_land_8_20_14_0_80_42_15]|uniref:Helix-hairpin-helix DNA-binding motif class 1 domain-containing protein n=1 Tax=Candidatus Aquitaenariimonas noxiae TaxID=1974741 RepID=A0A2J0KTS4_9BACT|nr:MAG: hypothetical protein COS99_03265 [Candidatus Omnitrophica bacterium CG07_land_8_20_14_0_80_42_15]